MPIDVVRIHGIESFVKVLRDLPATLQKKVIRQMLRDSMKTVRESARAYAPVLQKPVDKNGYPRRLPGTLRRAISVRTSKVEAKAGNVGVFVNVRPLPGNVYRGKGKARVLVKKSSSHADNPRDPYYWRWLEFGTQKRNSVKGRKVKDHRGEYVYMAGVGGKNRGRVKPYEFLHKSASRLDEAFDKFKVMMTDWVNKTDKTGRIE